MNPGLGSVCRNCRHFSFESWHAGHPNPCSRNRWIGVRHHAPALTDDGKQCDEFEAKPVKAKSPGKPAKDIPA